MINHTHLVITKLHKFAKRRKGHLLVKKICKKDKKEINCIKNLKDKRSNLQKGNLIEIPVIPYKR